MGVISYAMFLFDDLLLSSHGLKTGVVHCNLMS